MTTIDVRGPTGHGPDTAVDDLSRTARPGPRSTLAGRCLGVVAGASVVFGRDA
ncbi:hypothetical protein ACFXGA_13105 [Actinosynnema sp. NPDC059335]|uniref:hypothetical protein n=1 Tax=Actinosynnema sp. NPDC059335 TaxID=3346804 RepID=UPI00366B801A